METVLIKDISLLINAIGAGICFLLSYTYFLKNEERNTDVNHILSFLFFIIGFIILNTVLNFTGYSRTIYGFEPISNAFCLAMPPLLYLYIGKLRLNSRTNWIFSAHLFPFYGYLLFTLLVLFFPNGFLTDYGREVINGGWMVGLWNMQFAIYLLLTFNGLRKIRPNKRTNASLIFWGISSIWVINTSLFLFRLFYTDLPQLVYLNITLLFTFLTFRIAHRELSRKRPEFKTERPIKKEMAPLRIDEREIISLIKDNKYYRDSDLDIRKLASLLDIPYHQLSKCINTKYQKNFNEFINGFRIEEVVDALMSEEQNSFTIMGLAQQAGFNSGSAFYSAFKKEIGTTPKLFMQAKYSSRPLISSDL